MTDTAGFPAHIAKRVDEAHDQIKGLEGRVTTLERDGAVAAERSAHIQKSLASIEANISKVVWLIIAAIVGAVLTFIFKGGLNVSG